MKIQKCQKILIVGDAGRGKSTLSKSLSEKLNIQLIELDDIFWEKKYTKPREREESILLVREVLKNEKEWIIEGSTRRFVSLCLDSADCIIYLSFKNIFIQLFHVLRRTWQRRESFKPAFWNCVHIFQKRYSLGHNSGKKKVKEIIAPYSEKIIELNSWKSINKFLEGFD